MPALPDDPDPFEGQSADGGVMVFAFGALHQVVSTGPERFLDRLGGELMEGEFTNISTNAITLTSVLFGLKKIPLTERPRSLLLAAINHSAAPWIIILANGSRIPALTVAFTERRLNASTHSLGSLSFALEELAELRFARDSQKIEPAVP